MASQRLLQKYGVAFAVWTVLSIYVCGLNASAQAAPPSDGARVPVLLELFTSEGCSDCPPADRLLEELDAKQFVPGAQAIVLSEHVTYWNHLGWSDPFSMVEVDERQKQYGERFNLDSIYTPQLVVDGAAQVVGNNVAGVTNAIVNAASTAKKPLTIADAHGENGVVSFTVHGVFDSGSRLVAVLAADATGPKVVRGENAGRTLHHVAVVQVLKEFSANAADGKPLRLAAGRVTHDKDSTGPVRLVVFLVDRKTGHVSGVAEQMIKR